MRILTIALAGTAIVLAGCSSGGDDAAATNEVNATASENLDQAASDAANAAANAEAAALGDQMNELNAPAEAPASEPSPSDAQEQNVAGM